VVDHDDTKLLSSTQTGRLRMAEDSTGLLVDSEWPDTSYARDVRELGDAQELGGMSFEFSATAKGAPFSADKKKRTIREAKLYHVTVLTGKTPAYSSTTAGFRALANAIDADFEDVATLFDAVHEGRRLSPDEWNLLGKAVAQVAPDGVRWSSAASDASSASYALSSLISLLGEETDDTAQAGLLKTAITSLQAFIAAETDEIGTEADRGSYAAPKPNLAQARLLFPKS
jgi:HK97 family phage prohead protease